VVYERFGEQTWWCVECGRDWDAHGPSPSIGDDSALAGHRESQAARPEALSSLIPPAEALMRDQFGCRCRQSDSDNVDSVSTRDYVKTREYTFCRCRACGDVWRERHGVLRSLKESRRRRTDDRLRPARVA
jgi:hypothetical protein